MKTLTIDETGSSASPLTGSPCTVVLGNFDGVHRGHRCLLDEALRLKKNHGFPIVVYTFTDYPEHERLTDMTGRAAWLDYYGTDYLIYDRLARVRSYQPSRFAEEVLFGRLSAGALVCGFNYTFGQNRSGNAAMLSHLAMEHGISCSIVPAVYDEKSKENPISSTSIRQLVSRGNIEEANGLLGHPFCLSGEVCHGFAFGRTMGFPTANQMIDKGVLLPRRGVYFSFTKIDGRYYPAVTNIGMRPTVNEDDSVSIETHVIGYNGDLYGRRLLMGLLSYHRDEIRFPDKAALSAGIAADCRACEQYYADYPAEKRFLPEIAG